MMRTLLAVLCVVALCGEGASGASVQQRRHRRRHHLHHLQDAVDRLLLRQKIDHILITNLQEAMKEAQRGDSTGSHSLLSERVGEVEAEGLALGALRERVAEVRGEVQEVLLTEERRNDILEIRQELAFLRSEVKRLKESKAAESEHSAAHALAQQQREAVTAAWVVDNVRRLQDSVAELQQAVNVTAALHDKQEVESRLLVVTKDLGALRGSLAAVTSKAEAAVATSTALQEELTRTAEDGHRSAGKVAALATEVSGIREDFNNLLGALPEGTVAGAPSRTLAQVSEAATARGGEGRGGGGGGGGGGGSGSTSSGLGQRVAALEHRSDDLDFALSRTQQQVAANLPTSGTEERVAQVAEAERQLETKVEAAEAGVGEVRASSVQLLAALEALEARMEKEVTEVKQEVAKLEFKVGEASEAQQSRKAASREAHDDSVALRTDLQAVSRRLDHVTLTLTSLEGRKLEDEVAAAQCRSRYLTLNLRLDDTQQRLKNLEEQRAHSRPHHRHHLRPWRETKQDAGGGTQGREVSPRG